MGSPAKLGISLVGYLIPPDPAVTDFVSAGDPVLLARAEKAMREIRIWRWKVAGMLAGLTIFAFWVIFFSGFARATDVDARVQAAVLPLRGDIDEVANKLDQSLVIQSDLARAINAQLAMSEANTICRLLNRRKKEAEPDERRRLREEADRAQLQYKLYNKLYSGELEGEYYPEARCEL